MEIVGIRTKCSRFKNPLIPLHYHALTTPVDVVDSNICTGNQTPYGFALSRSKYEAEEKSISEFIERLVYLDIRNGKWPFDQNKPSSYITPAVSTGFAAHPLLEQAKDNALLELVERTCLYWLMRSETGLRRINNESLPIFYKTLLRVCGLRLDCFQFCIEIPTVFSLVQLSSGGCVFGSCSSFSASQALKSTLLTIAVRLMQFIDCTKWIHDNAMEQRFKRWTKGEQHKNLMVKIEHCLKRKPNTEMRWLDLKANSSFFYGSFKDRYIVQALHNRLIPADITSEDMPLL